MDSRRFSFFRSNRSARPASRARARRAGLAFGLLALAIAAGVGAWRASGDPRQFGPDRWLAAGALRGIQRVAASPPNQRLFVYSVAGMALLCIPLALAFRRRREWERQHAELVTEQQARAPEVFQAALAARPLRRALPSTIDPERGRDALPAPGEVPPEVAARAAALHAGAVREAAARAVMLRAASERSETRRRAAALRASARRDKSVEPSETAAPTVEVIIDPRPMAGARGAQPTPTSGACGVRPAPAPERPAALELAPTAATRSTPTLESTAPTDASATPRATEPRQSAPPASHATGRVAILRSSGPLTFEWLEQCLARDPKDIQARLDLCTALLVAERFADAERVAREGLARDASDGRLLLRLSEALSGLERNDEALEVAVRAVRRHRSRKAILHLTRLSAVARRFSPGDGARLRRALENRPNDPVFLHALGAFEVQQGRAHEGLPILRLALRQERNPRWRRIVSREIARVRADELSDARAGMRRAAS